MTTLENLWYGNIRPVEQFVEGHAEYKILLHLVANNREKLEATLSLEQAKLFEKYCAAVSKMNSISETVAFKNGFCIAVELFSESTK